MSHPDQPHSPDLAQYRPRTGQEGARQMRSKFDNLASQHTANNGFCPGDVVTILGAIGFLGGCGNGGSSDGRSELSQLPAGTYEMAVAADQPRSGCINGELNIELVVDADKLTSFRIVGGHRGRGQEFTYSLFRDRITIHNNARNLAGQWSFDGTNLTISELDGGRCEDESDWTAAPFVLGHGAADQSSPPGEP